MKTSITLDEVLELKRCSDYPDEHVKELFGDKTEATALEILTDIRLPDKDKVWLICYGGFLDKTLAVQFSRFCADRSLFYAKLDYSAVHTANAALWWSQAKIEKPHERAARASE